MILTMQFLLLAYSCLVLVQFGSLLVDWETTVRLVGSDVACSMSVVDCSWIGFTINALVYATIVGLALYSLLWRSQHRDRVIVGATFLAWLHGFVNWLLFTPA